MRRAQTFGILLLTSTVFLFNYILAVATPIGQRIENSALEESSFRDNPFLPLSAVQPSLIITFLAVISIYSGFKMGIFRAISTWFLAGLSMVAAQIAKIYLPRKNLLSADEVPELLENTLPSGHMSVFATIAVITLLTVSASNWKLTFWATTLVLIIVAWQLLDYGWHRPSDLIAALTITVFVTAIAKLLVPKAVVYTDLKRFHPESPVHPNWVKVGKFIQQFFTILILVGVFSFIIYVLVNTVSSGNYYLGASFITVVVAVLFMLRITKVFR